MHWPFFGMFVTGLVLSGCATHWTHPTADARQVAEDRAYCLAQANMAVVGQQDPFGMARNNVFALCMQGRGWVMQ
jgi:hypothetical protein